MPLNEEEFLRGDPNYGKKNYVLEFLENNSSLAYSMKELQIETKRTGGSLYICLSHLIKLGKVERRFIGAKAYYRIKKEVKNGK